MNSVSGYNFDSAAVCHMHNLLVPALAESIQRHQPHRVLDLGSGNGSLTAQLKARFPHIEFVGIEPSQSGFDHAREKHQSEGLSFLQGSVYDLPPEAWGHSFDLVYSAEVIEHLYFPSELPRYILQVLKPNGIAVITTPFHGYWKNIALSILNKWDDHHTVFWDHGHIKFWSRRTLTQLFEAQDFRFQHFLGLGRWPQLWMTMLLEFQKP